MEASLNAVSIGDESSESNTAADDSPSFAGHWDRQTKLIDPSGQTKVEAMTESEGESRGDGGVLLAALAKKASSLAAGGDDGPPLTTKAMRDLAALEKERVYHSVLVRIRYGRWTFS